MLSCFQLVCEGAQLVQGDETAIAGGGDLLQKLLAHAGIVEFDARHDCVEAVLSLLFFTGDNDAVGAFDLGDKLALEDSRVPLLAGEGDGEAVLLLPEDLPAVAPWVFEAMGEAMGEAKENVR